MLQAEALRFGENIADEEDVGEEEGFCYSDNRRMSIEVGVTGLLVSCSDASYPFSLPSASLAYFIAGIRGFAIRNGRSAEIRGTIFTGGNITIQNKTLSINVPSAR